MSVSRDGIGIEISFFQQDRILTRSIFIGIESVTCFAGGCDHI